MVHQTALDELWPRKDFNEEWIGRFIPAPGAPKTIE
jgi:hypothetical protein